MNDRINEPLMKVFTNQVNIFYYNSQKRHYPDDQGLNLLEDRKKAYSGKLSQASRRIIKERLTAWLYIIQSYNKLPSKIRNNHYKKLVMVTLTLSGKQKHTDKWIKENMLELFFKRMRYNYDANEYFWKAETQKNGNLHFHIWFDVYIDKKELQSHWNDIQYDNGYLNEFIAKYGYANPPSTQVEVIDNKEKAIDYCMKYVSKENEGRQLVGRIFSFSSKLLHIVLPTITIDSECSEYLEDLKKRQKANLIEDYYFSVLRWNFEISPINSKFPCMRYYQEYFSKLAKLFYLTDADESIIADFTELYCNFYHFRNDYDRYDKLLRVGKYLTMRWAT